MTWRGLIRTAAAMGGLAWIATPACAEGQDTRSESPGRSEYTADHDGLPAEGADDLAA